MVQAKNMYFTAPQSFYLQGQQDVVVEDVSDEADDQNRDLHSAPCNRVPSHGQ